MNGFHVDNPIRILPLNTSVFRSAHYHHAISLSAVKRKLRDREYLSIFLES